MTLESPSRVSSYVEAGGRREKRRAERDEEASRREKMEKVHPGPWTLLSHANSLSGRASVLLL